MATRDYFKHEEWKDEYWKHSQLDRLWIGGWMVSRFLVPGRQTMSTPMTILLGIVAHVGWRVFLFPDPGCVS